MSGTSITQHGIKSIRTTQRNHDNFISVSVNFEAEDGQRGEVTFFINDKENLNNVDLTPSEIRVVD